MTSFCRVILVAVIAASTVLLADAFTPIAGRHPNQQQRMTTPLSMGIFDVFQKAFGNEEYGDPPDAIKATARHILVPSLEDANMVLGEIGKGETSFASLAGRYSTCPSKARGGSLGSFGPGTMVKEFDEVVFTPKTRIGEVMGPVQTKFGYHLIVVDKRTGGSDWY